MPLSSPFSDLLKSMFIFLLGSLWVQNGYAQTLSPFIHVDQFGYAPSAEKVAVFSDPMLGFNAGLSYDGPSSETLLINAQTGDTVNSFLAFPWAFGATHDQSGDRGWWLPMDNTLKTPGEYYIQDYQGNRSPTFAIHPDPYREVMRAAGRMFYYNRCGFPKALPYAEANWVDGLDFQQDEQCRSIADPNNASLWKDLRGGWYDAGDYNKYVTFANRAIHDLLWAWEENPQAFTDEWNIPESNNSFPDLLDEVKWELDWLLKMIEPDGGVHIKMGSISFSENVSAPPSVNTDPRYYGPVCSSATISMASMLAHAARVYRQIEGWEGYAAQLGAQAELCFGNVLPQFVNQTLDLGCDDGTILAGDADWNETDQWNAAITASVHLFDLTGDESYHSFFLDHYENTEPISGDFWGPYYMQLNDALLFYTSLPGANPTARDEIRDGLNQVVINNWNDFYGFSNADLYRAYMPDWSYHWGSNLPKAAYGTLNLLVDRYGINPVDSLEYRRKAAEQLHYFHGVNPLGLVHLSNMYAVGGDRCANEIYHSWFNDGTDWDNALTSIYGPAPGFVVGGANQSFSVSTISPPSGQPAQKSYLDFNNGWPDNSWEITEPAIYSQAGYIRLLAAFVTGEELVAVNDPQSGNPAMTLFPNPTTGKIWLSTTDHAGGEILNVQGQVLGQIPAGSQEVDLSELPAGVLLLRIGETSLPVILQD